MFTVIYRMCVMQSITLVCKPTRIHTHTHTHTRSHTEVDLQQRGAGDEATGPWPHNRLLESDHQSLQHYCTNTPNLDPLEGKDGGVVRDGGFGGGEREVIWEKKEGGGGRGNQKSGTCTRNKGWERQRVREAERKLLLKTEDVFISLGLNECKSYLAVGDHSWRCVNFHKRLHSQFGKGKWQERVWATEGELTGKTMAADRNLREYMFAMYDGVAPEMQLLGLWAD